MAAANAGGGGGGHVRSKSEPVIAPGVLPHVPIRAPEGLSQRSVSMDSFDFYFRGNQKAVFMESSRQSVMQAVEDWRQRLLAFMDNLFSHLPEPIDFGILTDDDDDYDEDDHDIDVGASADDDLDIDGGDDGDGPDVAPAA